MEKKRVYFVIDMKSFFASVECVDQGLDAMTAKLVVADLSRGDKTICLAVSPALKALGVKNRCRLYEIPKNIDYIVAKPRMKRYIRYAAEIYGIYLKYIGKDDIHVYSIDECSIDVTDYLKIYDMRAKEFALKLITEIREKTGIPASAGIGSNMYLAKIALDLTAKNSPDKIGWLTEEKFIKELWTHRPLTDFWQISKGVASRLEHYGILDMKGIATCKEDILYKEFGVNAELIIDHAYGRETCLMEDIKNYKSKSKSYSSSQILPSNYCFSEALLVMKEMISEGCYRLAREKSLATHLNIYVGYGDNKGEGDKASATFLIPTNLYSEISRETEKIFYNSVSRIRPIRRLGYSFLGIISDSFEQRNLFDDYEKKEKEKRLTGSVLSIKDKYGKNAILRGVDFEPSATQRERNGQIGGHSGGTDQDAES